MHAAPQPRSPPEGILLQIREEKKIMMSMRSVDNKMLGMVVGLKDTLRMI